jgi:hypothetical protein
MEPKKSILGNDSICSKGLKEKEVKYTAPKVVISRPWGGGG